jgi:hypothetical protein
MVRNKKKFPQELSNLKQYRYYTKEYGNPTSLKNWNGLWTDFWYGFKDKDKEIQGIFDKIIFENLEVQFPHKMGTLKIAKKKVEVRLNWYGELDTKSLAVDWEATNKLWQENPESKKNKQRIFHTNAHTGGYRMGWVWNRSKANFKNKRIYDIDICRTIDRKLSKALKNPDYNLDFYLK